MNIKIWLAALMGVFAPVHTVMMVAGFLIIADLITGIMAAKKKGKKITSAAIRRTVSKIAVYQLVIMSGFLVEIYMVDSFIPISKIAASIIGVTELLSIIENCEVIYGKPIFKKIVSILGSENDQSDKD